MPKRPSDLFNSPAGDSSQPAGGQPATQPQQQQLQPAKTASNPIVTLLLVVLTCVLTYAVLTRTDWGRGDGKYDQHHEQKDDRKKQDDGDKKKQAVTVKPGWLHVVRERQDPPVAEQEVLAKLFDFCESQRKKDIAVELRDNDKDDDLPAIRKMIDYAKTKGIDPPFLLYKTKDNELRGVIKLPTTGSESEILEVFK